MRNCLNQIILNYFKYKTEGSYTSINAETFTEQLITIKSSSNNFVNRLSVIKMYYFLTCQILHLPSCEDLLVFQFGTDYLCIFGQLVGYKQDMLSSALTRLEFFALFSEKIFDRLFDC